MKTAQLPHSILVPVLDGDISEATLARGRSILVASDARLVFLHIARKPEPGDEIAAQPFNLDDAPTPRWRQLAAAAQPGRLFVEAMQGDPARIIAIEAERFHSDTILLDRTRESRALRAPVRAKPSSPPPQEGCMLTQPLVQFDRLRLGASVSPNADRRSSLDISFGPIVGAAVATFSEAAKSHRVSPATLDALIEELSVGLLAVDGDGEVSYANAAARTLEANAVPSLQRVVARALRTGQVVCEEFAVEPTGARGRLDPRRWLEVRAVPVRSAGARAHAALVTVNDITAQKNAKSWEPAIASLMSL